VRRYWTFFRKIPRNAPLRRNEEVTFWLRRPDYARKRCVR
jgi:hypothetical protein